MLADWWFGLKLRLRGMRPAVSMDCAQCHPIMGGSHLRVRSWSFWSATSRLRVLMHQYGWKDGRCPQGHGESTRIEEWQHLSPVKKHEPEFRPAKLPPQGPKRSEMFDG